MGFTHLQVRSAYSLLNSSIKIADYIGLATSWGLKSLALVEEGSMHSAIKFYTACQKAGIKPIIGMSLMIRGNDFEDRWTLIAKNHKGYEALLKLASVSALDNGGVDVEEIINESSNLIVITCGEGGVLVSAIEQNQEELLKLASVSALDNGGVDVEEIINESSNLIVITCGEGGVLVSAIEQNQEERLNEYYHQYLKRLEYLYIGLVRVNHRTYEVSRHLIHWTEGIGLKTVVLNDVRYIRKEDLYKERRCENINIFKSH